MVDQIRFFAAAARLLEGRGAAEYMAGHTSYVRREPIGVCAAVTPWNYPMMMAVWKWAPALAAGNTMVLKPSDTTPASTLFMAELMAEFLPPGVLNVICGDRDTGRLVVEHAVPQMVSVTGSVRAGKEVAASAAADAEEGPPRARRQGAGHRLRRRRPRRRPRRRSRSRGYFNAGQDCTAATRVLAGAEGLRRRRRRARRAGARHRRPGGPETEDVLYGPGEQRQPARAGARASSSAGPRTRRSPPVARGSGTAATSSSRRSSRGCARTTR